MTPVPALVMRMPLFSWPSMPSLLLPLGVVERMVPALKTTPLAPGRTASASLAVMTPPAWLFRTLAPVMAEKSTAWEPPADAFSDTKEP
jgi:hypothetical protein